MVVLARIFLQEALTPVKIGALLATLLGCGFVVGWLPGLEQNITLYSLIIGLGSGLGYGLYSVIGKPATTRYTPLTITTYTFIIAALFLGPLTEPQKMLVLLHTTPAWPYIMGLSLIPTVIAYLLYTKGLSMLESSRASIAATIELWLFDRDGAVEEITVLWRPGHNAYIDCGFAIQFVLPPTGSV